MIFSAHWRKPRRLSSPTQTKRGKSAEKLRIDLQDGGQFKA
jgi:hypothetical protein